MMPNHPSRPEIPARGSYFEVGLYRCPTELKLVAGQPSTHPGNHQDLECSCGAELVFVQDGKLRAV